MSATLLFVITFEMSEVGISYLVISHINEQSALGHIDKNKEHVHWLHEALKFVVELQLFKGILE